eukprot:symbB.v1.2.002536.t1/scaffold103.1/size331058/1
MDTSVASIRVQRTEDGRGQSTVALRDFESGEVLIEEPCLAVSFESLEPSWAKSLRSQLKELDPICAWQYCLAVRCLPLEAAVCWDDFEGLQPLSLEESQKLQDGFWQETLGFWTFGWKGFWMQGSPTRGTALVSFHLLPEIQHVQPEELDASEDPYIEYKSPHTTAAELSKYDAAQEFKSPASMKSELKSLETASMSSWLPPQLPANGKRRQVSSAFQTLLDQLAQQHVRELNESAKKTKVSARTGTKDSLTSTAPVDQKSSLRSRKSAGYHGCN